MTEKDRSTAAISRFWSERPMTFGITDGDVSRMGAQAVWEQTERLTLEKLEHLKDTYGRLLGRCISWSWVDGKEALEIGFGTGWLTSEIARHASRVEGVDLSQSHYEISSKRFEKSTNVHLQVGSAEALPFPDQSLDFVAAWGVLHHAESDVACYREVHRVLKPGGRCFLMLYRKGGPKYRWHKLFRVGILGGKLKQYNWDVQRFIESVTDAYDDESAGAPISRHYTRRSLTEALTDQGALKYAAMDIAITGNEGEWRDLPFYRLPLTNLLPRAIHRWLISKSGAYWLVTLHK